MTKIRFTIPGEPCAKGRPRHTKRGHVYTPAKTAAYENLVKLAYQAQISPHAQLDGNLSMTVWAFFQIPKSSSKRKAEDMRAGRIRPTKRPDADNVGKIVADALNGIAYGDDACIVDMTIRKYYADKPHVVVEIEVIET